MRAGEPAQGRRVGSPAPFHRSMKRCAPPSVGRRHRLALAARGNNLTMPAGREKPTERAVREGRASGGAPLVGGAASVGGAAAPLRGGRRQARRAQARGARGSCEASSRRWPTGSSAACRGDASPLLTRRARGEARRAPLWGARRVARCRAASRRSPVGRGAPRSGGSRSEGRLPGGLDLPAPLERGRGRRRGGGRGSRKRRRLHYVRGGGGRRGGGGCGEPHGCLIFGATGERVRPRCADHDRNRWTYSAASSLSPGGVSSKATCQQSRAVPGDSRHRGFGASGYV